MSLILALVLIAIVLYKVGKDKTRAAAFDREKSKRDAIASDWADLYVDKDLETVLERCIADERNYAAVHDEISRVLLTMEHWRYLLNGEFALNESQISGMTNYKQAHKILRKNQTIALDIMLANRGKVSMMASVFGYNAYVKSGNRDQKDGAYEYADTILKLMQLKDPNLKLYYYSYLAKEAYYWEGANPQHQNNPSKGEVLLAFDKDLLFKKNPIPSNIAINKEG